MVDQMRVGMAVEAAMNLVESDDFRPGHAESIIEPLTFDEELAFAEILRDTITSRHNGRKTTYWNVFQRHLEYYGKRSTSDATP